MCRCYSKLLTMSDDEVRCISRRGRHLIRWNDVFIHWIMYTRRIHGGLVGKGSFILQHIISVGACVCVLVLLLVFCRWDNWKITFDTWICFPKIGKLKIIFILYFTNIYWPYSMEHTNFWRALLIRWRTISMGALNFSDGITVPFGMDVSFIREEACLNAWIDVMSTRE